MPFFQGATNVAANYSVFNDYASQPFGQNAGIERQQPSSSDSKHHVINIPAVAVAPGWNTCIHPDGWLYFYHRESRLVTEDQKFVQTNHDISASFTKYEEFMISRGTTTQRIYINHELWYASPILSEALDSKIEAVAVQQHLQTEYWRYMHQYPAHQPLPAGAEEAARQALNMYLMEGLWRRSETQAPFTLDQCRELIEFLEQEPLPNDQVKQLSTGVPSQSAARTALVAWILLYCTLHRQINSFGQKTKQQLESSTDTSHSPGIFFLAVSFICLGAPSTHLNHISIAYDRSKLRGDVETWPAYVESLVNEWTVFNLAATVLLSASVAFLAVPGIDKTTRIATLISVVLTLGSIMSSVYLLWRHQIGSGSGKDELEYSISIVGTHSRASILAIILSIPFASLAWGVVAFLIAIILFSFLGTETTDAGETILFGHPTSIATVVTSAVMAFLIVVIISFFRFFRGARAPKST